MKHYVFAFLVTLATLGWLVFYLSDYGDFPVQSPLLKPRVASKRVKQIMNFHGPLYAFKINLKTREFVFFRNGKWRNVMTEACKRRLKDGK